jgi:hypothetical protein
MFTLFKKTRDNNIILKMFRVVTKAQAFDFDTKLLIDTTFNFLGDNFKTAPTNYYITGPYPDEG